MVQMEDYPSWTASRLLEEADMKELEEESSEVSANDTGS